ncbi:hypothetical protein [Streptomyces corynorhini]|uniref:Uncharacterized protein n=1 Tax=Streptomyces corynorhini TaxID=2282652 RepID=A0A370B755_9ACTN|nr:hypothetical protein [Streptomyces corynorhini]RDG36492.1 hypothetical protein DVH02_19765 [Streptomyces corynorhini]
MNPIDPQHTIRMLVLLLLLIVLASAFVVLLYVAYRHPPLATPLLVAIAGVTLLIALIVFVVNQL